ncbi:restriction endonuclease subunit S [Yersinia mollaretii]|uniref:Restriction endonuclease subunit S n=1 Tax=Yersinia mollaretii TaxID=33060 RepID=A0AA44CKE2_YERMO|nr:restriction endonuclease subunit S [Yersinia mollaretii]NIL22292.1 restriction endonuclease subunit S [Yersinia mollaretii]CNI51548.1 Type I restriction enzyme EcoKI specificity protein [Yersinia mollaretii]CQQ51088.1 Type I restriction enzyme EcoKI specificity protein [Yersinia mollaretii]
MAKYKAYPEYKDSEVEWLGEIPSSWNMWKLSHAYDVIGSGTTPTSSNETWFQGDIPWVTTGELRETVIYDTFKKITPFALKIFSALKIHPAGSIVIAMYGATIGRLGILGVDATTNQACCVMTKSYVINNQYLYYWLQAFREDIIRLSSGGGQPNINQEKVASLKISSPVWKEQMKITAFLDHETAKIDKLIENQQQLIELLKEKRQAVISHAVTKGLNPDVPMKDSGVEWLGEVPEHWDITKLKWIGKTTSGGTPTTSKFELYYEDGHIPWVRTTDLNNSELFDTPIRITSKAVNETACSILPVGSLLLGMYGGAGSIGKHSLLRFESTVNQAVCGVLPCEKMLPDFLHKYYEFYRPFWMIDAAGTRKDPNIGQDNIKEGVILIPPFEEQILINTHINEMHKIYECVISNAFEGINLLQERRTALISAAVTGKIDVRDWVAPDTREVEVLQEVTA